MRYAAAIFCAAMMLSACGGQGGSFVPKANPGPSAGGQPSGASSESLSGRTLFVGATDHTLRTYDEATGALTGQIQLPGSAATAPVKMSLTADAGMLYAAISPFGADCDLGASSVVKIDAHTGAIVDTTTVPDAFYDAVLSADGSTYAGVANAGYNSSGGQTLVVDVFSGANLHLVKRIPLPPPAVGAGLIALSQSGSTAYVTETSEDIGVDKVDIASGTVTTFSSLSGEPFVDATGLEVYLLMHYGLEFTNGNQVGLIGQPPNGNFYKWGAQTTDLSTIFLIGESNTNQAQGTLISTASRAITSSFLGAPNVQSKNGVSPDGTAGFTYVPETGYPYVDVYALPSGTLVSTPQIPLSSGNFVTAVAGQ